jgi:hypothetical protein
MSKRIDYEVESVSGCETAAPDEWVTYTVTGSNMKLSESFFQKLHWGVSVDGVTIAAPINYNREKETVKILMRS